MEALAKETPNSDEKRLVFDSPQDRLMKKIESWTVSESKAIANRDLEKNYKELFFWLVEKHFNLNSNGLAMLNEEELGIVREVIEEKSRLAHRKMKRFVLPLGFACLIIPGVVMAGSLTSTIGDMVLFNSCRLYNRINELKKTYGDGYFKVITNDLAKLRP